MRACDLCIGELLLLSIIISTLRHPQYPTLPHHPTRKADGIPKLVNVLLGFNSSLKDTVALQLCTLAAAAIKELAFQAESKFNHQNQDAICTEGAIPPIVAMLGGLTPQMQANAAAALSNLARGHPTNQTAITKTGAIAPLCNLMRGITCALTMHTQRARARSGAAGRAGIAMTHAIPRYPPTRAPASARDETRCALLPHTPVATYLLP